MLWTRIRFRWTDTRTHGLTLQKLYAPKANLGGIKTFLQLYTTLHKTYGNTCILEEEKHFMHLHSIPKDWGTFWKTQYNYIQLHKT